ncbi:hypothetical protein ACQCVP_13285 [Rossellomorea vietnamensis]|uniref:hypothetical protein n=1 Tax=Rossellomorea vietnamensis TaxID=218284 RepID=UPI003CEAB0CA
MKAFVSAWSKRFNNEKYPYDFYIDSLKRIEISASMEELAETVIGMLHWKDGKVSKDPNGNVLLNGRTYTLKKPKPHTYQEETHKQIFYSKEFFAFALNIRDKEVFDPSAVGTLTGNGLQLWSSTSIVIPTFVLHILSPKIYPLYDQHVERAKRALLAEELNQKGYILKFKDYLSYEQFFEEFLVSHYGKQEEYSLHKIKEVDKALWSFGKSLKRGPSVKKTGLTVKGKQTVEPIFKGRVLELIKKGESQRRAFEIAGHELGITLTRSQQLYPGSVIHRWRQQEKI